MRLSHYSLSVLLILAFLSPVQAANLEADHLVLIVLDGCKPEYLDLVPMPSLKELLDKGYYYDQAWVGQLVDNTPTGHASIGTGLFPKNTGIVNFFWKDPATGRVVVPTTLKRVTSGSLEALMDAAGAESLVDKFKAQHPGAVAASVSTTKYYAAAAMGSDADCILFAVTAEGDELTFEEMQHGPTEEHTFFPGAVKGHEASEEIMKDPELILESPYPPGAGNTWAVDLALKVFAMDQPQIMMINLPETDEVGHATGADYEAVKPIMSGIDRELGRILQAYEDADILDRTVFVVMADHGMIPNEETIDPSALRSALLLDRSGHPLADWPYVWLSSPGKSKQIAKAMVKKDVEGIIGAYAKVGRRGVYSYEPAISWKANVDPTLQRAYSYLTSTFACSTGPDVVLATEENTQFGKSSEPAGDHEELTWGCQHVPLIIAGPGVKHGVSHAPARLADIAPTALTVLGVSPGRSDGVVLADALEKPKADWVKAQSASNKKLTQLRDALKARSCSDLAEAA